MLVAVAAQGERMDSHVDPKFGRCPYFVVVDPETMKGESLPNPGAGASGGAGMSTAQALVKAGVSAVIAGNIGPNAITALSSAGIGAYIVSGGTVADAVDAYKAGTLARVERATVPQHAGVGRG
ncbi:MAG: NifB/NifX family molybdenum-iron cluster-binding protein [Ignavibacteriales bacterium]